MIVRVAVDVALPAIDKLYDYTVPEDLRGGICRGVRVIVPFGQGNRKKEAVVLAVADSSDYKRLKNIDSIADKTPLLDEGMLKLAIHMRERINCTFYGIVRQMLPAGLWFRRETLYTLSEGISSNNEAGKKYNIDAVIEYFKMKPEPVNERRLAPLLEQGQSVQKLYKAGVLERVENFKPVSTEKIDFTYFLTDLGFDSFQDDKCVIKGAVRREILEFLYRIERAALNEIEYYTGASKQTVTALLKEGYIGRETYRVFRRQETDVYIGKEVLLNEEQKEAVSGISTMLDANKYAAALLFGVTGSGKTEVYIKLIEQVISSGKSVIVLVPEIALTPQMTSRFFHEFGDDIAVLHSALTVGERYDEWQRIQGGMARVVVGTRSAVFSPVRDLGLIIIDEEHEHTFRSENDPRYHARDVAKYRCLGSGAVLLLGSATPSLDTAYAARNGEYKYFELGRRAVPVGLPGVVISDKRAAYRAGFSGCLGPELIGMIKKTIENHEQAILFLNRRGSSSSISCMSCGHVPGCVNCSSALSYHKENMKLICHQCGYSIKMITECLECGSGYLEPIGAGTQTLEEELGTYFPEARIIRMDSDSTSGRNSHMELLGSFAAGEADILLGTQMIAKGLNFPNVTLSAVIDADMSLYTGDFRSTERTFSLITQVVGRSGRAEKPGMAVIQTLTPGNDVIVSAAEQDFWAFYDNEIELRRALRQPPFCRMIQITISSALEIDAYNGSRRMASRIKKLLEGAYRDLEADLLGPVEAQIFKLNNRYRYTLTLRCSDSKRQREFLTGVLLEFSRDKLNRNITVYSDINL